MLWWLNTFLMAFVGFAPNVPLPVRVAFFAFSAFSLLRALAWGRGK